MRRHHGFTLIELMVVVAIIGILAAVAIPAFMKNARKAKTAEAITDVDQMYGGVSRFRKVHQKLPGSVRELLDAGYIERVTAAAFGAESDLPSLDNPAGGRADGYIFVYEVDKDGQRFRITAVPAAANRSGGRSLSIDDAGILIENCGPGQVYNPATDECVPNDNFLIVKAVRVVTALDALSGGRVLPLAQQFVKSIDKSKLLQILDANGDGRLDLDEIIGPDLVTIGRHLHPDFGKAAKPGQREDLAALRAIVDQYLRAVRDDLAPGIAGAPPVSVPIADLDGDAGAFLGLVPPGK